MGVNLNACCDSSSKFGASLVNIDNFIVTSPLGMVAMATYENESSHGGTAALIECLSSSML